MLKAQDGPLYQLDVRLFIEGDKIKLKGKKIKISGFKYSWFFSLKLIYFTWRIWTSDYVCHMKSLDEKDHAITYEFN